MSDVAAGADAFRLLALRLRDAGETDLKRELYKAISDAAQPVLGEIRTGLPDRLPNPYAATLAGDLSLRVSKRTGNDPGVRLTARGRARNRHVTRIDQGILRHPVFADSNQPRGQWRWVTQQVRPGFFTDPTEAAAPQVRQAILRAMHDVAAQVTRKA